MITIDECIGEKLLQLRVKRVAEFASAENCVLADEIVFKLENNSIRIVPLTDTDELVTEFLDESGSVDTSEFETILPGLIGKTLSAVWSCVNENGYSDMFVLSFENLHPSLLVLSEG